ncbi:MAG: hypothetical protein ACOZCF_05285 [Bacillota bacterium]
MVYIIQAAAASRKFLAKLALAAAMLILTSLEEGKPPIFWLFVRRYLGCLIVNRWLTSNWVQRFFKDRSAPEILVGGSGLELLPFK